MSKEFEYQLNSLVSSIVCTFNDNSRSWLSDLSFLPNKNSINESLEMLLELLFPGYFEKEHVDIPALEYHIGTLLSRVHRKLRKQIGYALKHQASATGASLVDVDAQAEKIIYTFLSKIPELREILATDVQAAFDGDPAAGSKDEIIFCYPGIFAISIYRLAHELHLLEVPLIPRIMTEYAHGLTGIEIHPGATIGRHFFIDHGTGVVIGETTIIGDYVKIYQGVTLGALSTRGGQKLKGVKRHPTLEDEVTVYSNVSILGGETVIGKGVVIGGNAFITRSIPAGAKVSMKSPGLMIKGDKTEEYIGE